MKTNRICTAAAIAALPLAALAQTPDAVERPDSGKDLNIGHQQVELPQEVLWDSLWIVDGDVVDYGNGDAISGIGIFGFVYDLEVADAFEVPSAHDITRVVMDYLNFFGRPYSPATDVLVEFFEDIPGAPSEVPTYQMTGTTHYETGIYVSWWPDGGTRVDVTFDPGEVTLPAGTWWVAMQPVDITSEGDWYYVCRKNEILFLDSQFRDGGTDHGGLYGGPYGGGYESDDWITATSFGYPGTSSFRVEGEAESGFALSLNGECPGMMEACVTGATPGKFVVLVYGACGGEWVNPRFPCEGVVFNVGDAVVADAGLADANGYICMSGRVPLGACGRICVQALDVATCTTSNVVVVDG